MNYTFRRLFVTQQYACILNRVLNNSRPSTNCVRQLNIFPKKDFHLSGLYRLGALQAACDSGSCPNQILHTSIRCKSNKKNRRSNRNESDEEDDEDSDGEKSKLDEFRQGDKASDRNLTEIKVQTLRLDTVIKFGLGFSKK